jgi:hypothetical protein
MATETIAVKAQPRLVIAGERVIQTGSVWPIKPPDPPAPLRQPQASNSMATATSIGPISSHLLKAEDAPNCVQALELISCAAQTMTSIEHQSKRIQATALALTRHTRSERVEFSQQITSLQEQVVSLQKQLDESQKRLDESEARAELSEQQFAEAEKRAATAEEWLLRLQQAIIAAFAERRMDNHLDEAANALSGVRL